MMSAWHLAWIIPVCASIGFVTAALLAAGKDSDMQGQPNYLDPHNMQPFHSDNLVEDRVDRFPGNDSNRAVKESLTAAWNPPANWCGEQAVDEIGTVYRCYICGRALPKDTHLCELCVRQHSGKVNV